MTKTTVLVTIGASGAGGRQHPVTSYLGACKVEAQVQPGSTGLVYIGGASVLDNGTGQDDTLQPGNPTTNPGGYWKEESQDDRNTIDVSTYYFHGSHAGDTVTFTYYQN